MCAACASADCGGLPDDDAGDPDKSAAGGEACCLLFGVAKGGC